MAIKMSIEINELIQIPSQLLRQDKILIVMSLLQHLTLHLNNSQRWSSKKQLSDESSQFSTVIIAYYSNIQWLSFRKSYYLCDKKKTPIDI